VERFIDPSVRKKHNQTLGPGSYDAAAAKSFLKNGRNTKTAKSAVNIGFASSEQRFNPENVMEAIPGPGQYV